MERLDFCSVMGILRRYVSEDMSYKNGIGISQIDFLYMLFDDYFQNGDTDNFVLDNGLVCRWINGQAKVSPKITGYYISDKKGRNDFADNDHYACWMSWHHPCDFFHNQVMHPVLLP